MYPFASSSTNIDSDCVSEDGYVYDSGADTLVDNVYVDHVNTEHMANSVKGRLKQCYRFWRDVLHAPEPILRIVQCGYQLPLLREPKAYCRPNNHSVHVHVLIQYMCMKHLSQRQLQDCWHSSALYQSLYQ